MHGCTTFLHVERVSCRISQYFWNDSDKYLNMSIVLFFLPLYAFLHFLVLLVRGLPAKLYAEHCCQNHVESNEKVSTTSRNWFAGFSYLSSFAVAY